MKVWNVPTACRMFRYALKGDAREWLKSVTKGSIVSFDDLKEKFRARFSQQKKHKKIHVAAHGIKQKETEGCRTLMDRFTTETEDIVDLPESQRISGLLHGLRSRGLVEFLYRDLPKTYEAVLNRAHVYLDARDTALKGDTSPTQEKKTPANRKGKWIGEREKPRYTPYHKDDKGYLKVNLPELHKSPKEILLTESVAKTFPILPRLSGKNRKDPEKYCEFHRDYGHDTNACWQLRKAIEEAINDGKLSHLVKSVRQQHNVKKEDDADEKKKGPEKKIYTITKIKPGSGFSLPKIYKGDIGRITFPQIYKTLRDPLVISAVLEISKVKNIIVDIGSECDVLYEKAFWKLHPVALKLRSKGTQGTKINH
uniref:uncharacterized protein LOC122609097 n=1 Tax=Erigeron canadensis TaxID=72917 RepID=UPI001CB8F65B|nr:uncharacterized protein LOC122609097 [Erigeron canadensis]